MLNCTVRLKTRFVMLKCRYLKYRISILRARHWRYQFPLLPLITTVVLLFSQQTTSEVLKAILRHPKNAKYLLPAIYEHRSWQCILTLKVHDWFPILAISQWTLLPANHQSDTGCGFSCCISFCQKRQASSSKPTYWLSQWTTQLWAILLDKL